MPTVPAAAPMLTLPARTLVVLGTGGTIAGRAGSAHDHVGYTAGQVGVAELLAEIGRAHV